MKILLLFFLFVIPSSMFAQDYWHSVGVRGGLSSGITYKRFVDEENAFEGILSFNRGFKATLLKEIHQPKYHQYSENFYLFHGFGGHFGFLNEDYNSKEIDIFNAKLRKSTNTPIIGLDAMIGFEYRFETVPFVFGIEYKPYFDIFGKRMLDLHMADFAFALRYTY